MSEMRKIPQERVKLNLSYKLPFERAYMSITSVNAVNQIHVVYDSYLEGSLAESDVRILHSQCRWIVFGLVRKINRICNLFRELSFNKNQLVVVQRLF